MKKEEIGVVIEVEGNMAKVRAGRHGDCKNCGSCPGDKAMILYARNQIGAQPGQRVAFEIQETNMLKAAFIVYILPIAAIFLGAALGELIGKSIGQAGKLFQVVGGIVAFILSIVLIKVFDKSARNDDKMQPIITRSLT